MIRLLCLLLLCSVFPFRDQRHVRSVDLLLFGFGSDFRFWLCDVFHLFFLASLVAAASDDDDDGSTPHSTTLLLDSPPSPL